LGLKPLEVVNRGVFRFWASIDDLAGDVPFLSFGDEYTDAFANQRFGRLVAQSFRSLLKHHFCVRFRMTLELGQRFRGWRYIS